MVEIVNQLCVKSWEVKAENGDHFKAQQGETYTTTVPIPETDTIVVFSRFWVRAPKENFVLVEEE